jgi:ATP-dependent Clp protease ATP-binding subunit ClpB
MDLNRFTEKAQDALRAAQTLAARLSHQHVDNEHLMVALLEQEQGIAPNILLKAGFDLEKLHRKLMAELERQPKVTVSGGASGMYLTQRLAGALGNAEQEARRMKDDFISVEHLLLALQAGDGFAGQLFREQGGSAWSRRSAKCAAASG